ncbi:hypothetical protein [Pedobacter sp. SYP-B3415]|uniref:hypothetical protein n=1 Tax=Pedobacter sp. SYP-B3415 TaxID=2496641 RepID=UPI00101D1BBD|nr:hypothetical protein [Pedobacter sp. SYP-B3415]
MQNDELIAFAAMIKKRYGDLVESMAWTSENDLIVRLSRGTDFVDFILDFGKFVALGWSLPCEIDVYIRLADVQSVFHCA